MFLLACRASCSYVNLFYVGHAPPEAGVTRVLDLVEPTSRRETTFTTRRSIPPPTLVSIDRTMRATVQTAPNRFVAASQPPEFASAERARDGVGVVGYGPSSRGGWVRSQGHPPHAHARRPPPSRFLLNRASIPRGAAEHISTASHPVCVAESVAGRCNCKTRNVPRPPWKIENLLRVHPISKNFPLRIGLSALLDAPRHTIKPPPRSRHC